MGISFPHTLDKIRCFTSVGLHKNVFAACLYISEGTADIYIVCYFVTEKHTMPGDFHFMENRKKRTNYPHFIGVRLSDFELDRLDQNAKLLGISRSEYVRKLLIEKEIKNHIEIVADMDDLKKLVGEYGKIGSNLNQIAKYFNTGGMRSLAIEDEIHQCIADLFKLRKKVLEMAGDTDGSS